MNKRTGIDRSALASSPERRPKDWTGEEQLSALIETNGMTGETLQAWCREKGIFVHNLTSWRTAFCAGGKEVAPAGGRELRSLKDENVKLKRDLVRKDKALAEAAALLILQKKFRALWDEEDK